MAVGEGGYVQGKQNDESFSFFLSSPRDEIMHSYMHDQRLGVNTLYREKMFTTLVYELIIICC